MVSLSPERDNTCPLNSCQTHEKYISTKTPLTLSFSLDWSLNYNSLHNRNTQPGSCCLSSTLRTNWSIIAFPIYDLACVSRIAKTYLNKWTKPESEEWSHLDFNTLIKCLSIIYIDMTCQNTEIQLPNGGCDSGLIPQQRPPVLLTPLLCVVRYTPALLSLVLPHHFFFLSAVERRGTGGGERRRRPGLVWVLHSPCSVPSLPPSLSFWPSEHTHTHARTHAHTHTHRCPFSVLYLCLTELKGDVPAKATSTTVTGNILPKHGDYSLLQFTVPSVSNFFF